MIRVLADYLAEVVPGLDRAAFELRWEQFVSVRLMTAENEADVFVARQEQAEREAVILDGVPLDGPRTPGGLTIVGGAP